MFQINPASCLPLFSDVKSSNWIKLTTSMNLLSYSLIILVLLTRWKAPSPFLPPLYLMGLRTCYPQIYNLDILNILNQRSLRKQQKQGHSDLRLTFLPWNRSYNPHVEGALPIPAGKQHPYLWRQGDTKKILTNRPCQVSPSLLYNYLLLLNLSDFYMTLHSSSNLA